ncbi:TPA: GYD domain-containing protein [Thermoplasmata archaeon]|nr:GYD domain-containing protein [Thermoplasmata archaeon]
MAVYAVLSKLTDEGRKTLKAKPERVKEVNEEISNMGARVLHQFALLGEYDFLTILEAENDVAISKVMVDLGSRGTLETSTLPAIPIDDFLSRFKA